MAKVEVKDGNLVVNDGNREMFLGKSGVWYTKENNQLYVASFDLDTVEEKTVDEEGKETVTKNKDYTNIQVKTDAKGNRYVEVNRDPNRAQKRQWANANKKHHTKKLRTIRGKKIYGEEDLTRLLRTGMTLQQALRV